MLEVGDRSGAVEVVESVWVAEAMLPVVKPAALWFPVRGGVVRTRRVL